MRGISARKKISSPYLIKDPNFVCVTKLEYLNLYNNNVLTADDLNEIRKFGIFLMNGSDK